MITESAPRTKPDKTGKIIDWPSIEAACINGMDFATAAATFGVKDDTIRKRDARFKWPTPARVAKRARELAAITTPTLDKLATDWNANGEAHRKVVFNLTHESLKKMKVQAPRNFREAEAADKMARRAAGLETADVQVATLIQLNEKMESFEDEEPIEVSATIIEDSGQPQAPAADNPITQPQEQSQQEPQLRAE